MVPQAFVENRLALRQDVSGGGPGAARRRRDITQCVGGNSPRARGLDADISGVAEQVSVHGNVRVNLLVFERPSSLRAVDLFHIGDAGVLLAGGAGQKNACIANMKQIDGAKATWALENKKVDTDVPVDADLFGNTAYIRVKPSCPGTVTPYTLGNVATPPSCAWSASGHVLP